MTSLKDWNAKLPSLKTFAQFNIYMRRQYLDLETARGLTIQNSSLNMMQEFKNHQKELSNTCKTEFQNAIRETMQALSLSTNKKNINPNQGLIPPGMSSRVGYGNQCMQLPEQSSEDIATFQQMFGTIENKNNTMMVQLLQQIQTMQQQISGLSLTNQQLSQFVGKNKTTNQGGNNKKCKPKNGFTMEEILLIVWMLHTLEQKLCPKEKWS